MIRATANSAFNKSDNWVAYMRIDIWKFESRLYADIDASGASGRSILKKKYPLGYRQFVNAYIHSKGQPLSNQLLVTPKEMKFSLHFRKNTRGWYRIDNDHNFTHMHLIINKKPVIDHYPLEGKFTVAELVSCTIEQGRQFLKQYFREYEIRDSKEGFKGFTRP